MKTSRFLTRLLLAVSAVAATAGVFAQNIATDPLVRQLTDRSNWEPGGRYYSFSDRGTVTSRSGQINTLVTSNIRAGSVSIQNASIQGTIGFVNSFSGHGWQDHSPFDNVVSRSDSATNQRADGSSTSVSLSWSGTENHPANGYDGPQGGGYPAPGGARDIYSFTVRGTAQGTYLLNGSELQAADRSSPSTTDVKTAYGSTTSPDNAAYGPPTCAYLRNCPPRPTSDPLHSMYRDDPTFAKDLYDSYANRAVWENILSPLGGLGTTIAQRNFNNQFQDYLSRQQTYDRLIAQAENNNNAWMANYYKLGSAMNAADMYASLAGNSLFASASEMLSPVEFIGLAKNAVNGAINIGKGGAKLTSEMVAYYKSMGAVGAATDATKSLTPVVNDVISVAKAVKPDFIVSVDGAVAHSSPASVRSSLEEAGFIGKTVQNPAKTEAGTIYNIPDMKMDVRVMDGGPNHPPRVVVTRQGTSQPVNPSNGSNFGNIPKVEQRERSHIVFP